MARASQPTGTPPPLHVIYGEEEFAKSRQLAETLNCLLPPEVDRSMALTVYDGAQPEDSGGPTLAAVMDDLMTLPFLSDRRVVVIHEADAFISAHRERLERWVEAPSRTGVLVLVCRSFPKTTRLYKAAVAARASLHECAKLNARAVPEFLNNEAGRFGKRLDRDAAGLLAELIGPDQGLLTNEVEKLALFVGERPSITARDVRDLVGQSREEKVFAVMDAAGTGDLEGALRLWRGVLDTDREAIYRAVGGIAYVLRRWLAAQEMRASGTPVSAIAPKVMMWGRERELQILLHRLPLSRLRGLIAGLAELDMQAKSGTRTIENGIEALLVAAAHPS